MSWYQRERWHKLEKKAASAANISDAARATVPDHITAEKARRKKEKEKRPDWPKPEPSARQVTVNSIPRTKIKSKEA